MGPTTARATSNQRDPTQIWRTSQVVGQHLMIEDNFVAEMIGERARLFFVYHGALGS